jgi:hypothetical protein
MRRDIGVDVFAGGGAGAGPLDLCAHISPSPCAWYGRARVKRGAGLRERERWRVILDLRRGFAGLRFGSGQRSRVVGHAAMARTARAPVLLHEVLNRITPACPSFAGRPGLVLPSPVFICSCRASPPPSSRVRRTLSSLLFSFLPPSSSTKR